MKSIIVEDEVMARKSIETLCSKVDAINIVGIYEDAESALTGLEKQEVDLIFLDIDMPGMSGLELLDKISVLPQIIFTTGNKEYAYDAYEYEVTDFLTKPITQPRFLKAIEKAISNQDKLNAIAHASTQNEIYIKADGRFVRLAYDDIFYFENVGDYVKVVSSHGNFIIHGSMKSIDNRIAHPRFLKVHRSYIVNMDKIKDIEDNTIVIEKKVIPVSRSHRPILMKSINIL